MIGRKTMRNFVGQSCKAMAKILYGNSEKKFSRMRKNGLNKTLLALFPQEFFRVCIIKSVSMRKPGRTRQEMIQLKSPILLTLGINESEE